mgnify:CR=1 FL=1
MIKQINYLYTDHDQFRSVTDNYSKHNLIELTDNKSMELGLNIGSCTVCTFRNVVLILYIIRYSTVPFKI